MSQSGSKWFNNAHPRPHGKVRLVCFPHGGGGPSAYREWAAELPDWIEVAAVSLPGRGARRREPAITDLVELKTAVADALGEFDDRPLCLFGHSVGALVAFEVARELEARGGSRLLRVVVSGYAAPDPDGAGMPLRPSWRDIGDDDLLAFLTELGHGAETGTETGAPTGVPAEAIADPELKAMMLDAVRTDFCLAEAVTCLPGRRLSAPLTVFGGADDAGVPEAGLRGWQRHADLDEVRLFPGGHFFTETCRPQLLEALVETLEADLARLPPSIMKGPASADLPEATLHRLFSRAARATPDAPALFWGDTTTTFAQLDAASDLLARRLIAQGAGRGRLSAILMETSDAYVVALLAALKTGGGYLPIPASTPPRAIADILAAAAPVAMAVSPASAGQLPPDWRDPSRTTVVEPGWQQTVASRPLGDLDAAERAGPDDLAYCVMTSGTTGKPKGILCPHRGAVNSYAWRYRHMPYSSDDREACNVFFVWEVLRPLFEGRPAIIIPDEVIFDPRRLISLLQQKGATRVLFTPSLLDQILDAAEPGFAQRLSALRVVILNGEVVTSALVARFAAALPHVELWNDYSISECHDVTTTQLAGPGVSISPAKRFAPVGRPMDNVNVYILDADGRPVPDGAPGEVYVGGHNVALGYLNAPEETDLRFRPDPFATPNDPPPVADASPSVEASIQSPRMFRTGDIGRRTTEGSLEISGRSHFMVKVRGYSVVPAAIEAELRAHPAVGAALVVTIDDPDTGQPEDLAAYVAGPARPPGPEDLAAIRAFLRDRLPHYAIPAELIPLSALPIDTATGKVDRRRLPAVRKASATASARAGDRLPLQTPGLPSRADANEWTASPADVRARLADIWRDLLGRRPAPGDSFFDLGGHSLLAARMTRAVEQALKIHLNVIDVFDHPTLEGYATWVSQQVRGNETARGVAAQAGSHHSHNAATAPRQRPPASRDIAVVGMAGRFPGARDLEAFWELIVTGRSALRHFTREELRERGVPDGLLSRGDYVRVGAIIDNVADFDPRFWGLSQAEATIMDPQQRLFLECCWHALEAAGHTPADVGNDIGVFAGTYLPSYLVHHLGAATHLDPGAPTRFHLAEIGNDKDYLASRVAYLMDLTGPAIGVQTSCSTGLVAIAQAVTALREGHCRMALAGASSISFPQGGFVSAEGHIATATGICRAFDAKADGTILGDGVGVVALRPLADALSEGDTVLAVIKGAAINNDGATKAGYSAPSAAGQAAVIRQALDNAGLSADSIGYLEAHGTGTRLGDPIEIRGARDAFRQDTGRRGYCALGSVKPNIGHANIAAGVAGFMKAVMVVRSAQIPPMTNFDTENPALELSASPFFVPREAMDWPSGGDTPRRAGVSSFGIGGTNCHVVIEQAPPVKPPLPVVEPATSGRMQLLPISAKTPEAAGRLANRLAAWLEAHPDAELADIAATLQATRAGFPHRRAIAATTAAAAASALRQLKVRPGSSSDGSAKAADQRAMGPLRVAFVFPGHGAHYAGMGLDLYDRCATFRARFDEAASHFDNHGAARSAGASENGSQAVSHAIDFSHDAAVPLIDRMRRSAQTPSSPSAVPPISALTLQPALFAIEVAMARTLIDFGVTPAACCGHSLGEYAAAVIAGALSDRDGARLVLARAAATARAPAGAMLSLAASEATAQDLLAQIPSLALAAVNSPRDCVVSGAPEAVRRAAAWAADHGIAARPLPVAVAFHSPLMRDAADALRSATGDVALRPPQIPLASNLDGGFWPLNAARDADYWSHHMLAPVRFADNVAAVNGLGIRVALELGPGRSLRRPMEACSVSAGEASHATEGTTSQGATVICAGWRPPPAARPQGETETAMPGETLAFFEAMARLWELGSDIDWQSLRENRSFRRIALPGYPFERVRCWPDETPAVSAPVTSPTPATALRSETRLPFAAMFHQPSWQRTPPQLQTAEPAAACYVLVAPESGPAAVCAERLRDRLAQTACPVALLRSDDDPAAHFEAIREAAELFVVDAGGSAPLRQRRIVDFTFLAVPPRSEGRAVAQTAALATALDHLGDVSVKTPLAYWAITAGGLRVAEEPTLPHTALLAGPILVASQEVRSFASRLIDVPLSCAARDEEAGNLAGVLAAEIAARHPRREPLLAVRGRHLWVERYEPLAVEPAIIARGKDRLSKTSGPHVITGGLGRIGLTLARELVSMGRSVALLSRRPDPGLAWRREVFGTGTDLVEVISCDVADAAALAEQLDRIAAAGGGLGGVFHCAGLADLRYLNETDRQSVAAEARSKLAGTDALATALSALARNRAVRADFVYLFSSLAAVLGGLGMTGYTAANRYLDAYVAQCAEREGTPWFAMNFDDWDFDYAKEQVGAFAHTRAGLALSQREGLDAIFLQLGAQTIPQMLISVTPLAARISRWTMLSCHTAEEAVGTPSEGRLASDPDAHGNVASTDDVLSLVLKAYAKVIGARDLELDADFFELGGDSLLAAQLAIELRAALPRGTDVRIADIFDHPTPRQLARRLDETGHPPSQPRPMAAAGTTARHRAGHEDV